MTSNFTKAAAWVGALLSVALHVITIATGGNPGSVVTFGSTASAGQIDPFGFWGGLWHGIIAPVDLILMLFRNDITVYATNTNGAFYAFGFILGSGGWGLLGGHRMSRSRRHRK